VKNIADYAYLVMKKNGSPMHFREIAKAIQETFGKKAHEATTHNELIKSDRFVLVGRGIYALSEWGYRSGPVVTIIEHVLREHGPLTRDEIIERVGKERYVKTNTILVNLQQCPQFTKTREGKYAIKKISEFIKKADFKKIESEAQYLLKTKIVIQNIVAHVTKPKDHIILMAALDEDGLIALDNVGCIFVRDSIDNMFLVALLNSKFMSWYAYRFIYAKAIRTMRLDKYHLSKMPLCNYESKSEYSKIILLANKMVELNKELQKINNKHTIASSKIEAEIKKTDKEIDELVYELYGIANEEKKIIEESLGK